MQQYVHMLIALLRAILHQKVRSYGKSCIYIQISINKSNVLPTLLGNAMLKPLFSLLIEIVRNFAYPTHFLSVPWLAESIQHWDETYLIRVLSRTDAEVCLRIKLDLRQSIYSDLKVCRIQN